MRFFTTKLIWSVLSVYMILLLPCDGCLHMYYYPNPPLLHPYFPIDTITMRFFTTKLIWSVLSVYMILLPPCDGCLHMSASSDFYQVISFFLYTFQLVKELIEEVRKQKLYGDDSYPVQLHRQSSAGDRGPVDGVGGRVGK